MLEQMTSSHPYHISLFAYIYPSLTPSPSSCLQELGGELDVILTSKNKKKKRTKEDEPTEEEVVLSKKAKKKLEQIEVYSPIST
jgi:hypothetical protein